MLRPYRKIHIYGVKSDIESGTNTGHSAEIIMSAKLNSHLNLLCVNFLENSSPLIDTVTGFQHPIVYM